MQIMKKKKGRSKEWGPRWKEMKKNAPNLRTTVSGGKRKEYIGKKVLK